MNVIEQAKKIEKQMKKASATLTEEEALECIDLYDEWQDLTETFIDKSETPYIKSGGKLYAVKQNHKPKKDRPPESTPALYRKISPGTAK